MAQTIQLLVTGRVQGVGYRAWAERQARSLGLDGWVRNRRDGSVEIVARGDAEALSALENACHRGPVAAEVTGVERHDTMETPEAGFHQRPTL